MEKSIDEMIRENMNLIKERITTIRAELYINFDASLKSETPKIHNYHKELKILEKSYSLFKEALDSEKDKKYELARQAMILKLDATLI